MSAPDRSDCDAIHSLPELIAYTHAMETEAADRYLDFSDQMEVHNNPEVAELFRKLSYMSDELRDHFIALGSGLELPRIAPWDYRFECIELLAADNMDDLHYLMTPHHVVTLALKCKQRLVEFFQHMSETRDDTEVSEMARRFMQAQAQHVALLEQWLTEHPKPEEDWHEDPDPPMLQE